jgi:hypothetical protein
VLRQIARLARRVPALGPRVIAISVYGDASGNLVSAKEAGFEGVACIDDAARALELYCALWEATRLPWLREWCDGLLDFVLAMQLDDGRWVNFILDWDGVANTQGRTSLPGGGFWQARALLALARASRCLDDPRIQDALRRGLPHIEPGPAPADVRVLHILTALELFDHADHRRLRGHLDEWLDEMASCRIEGALMNAPAERGRPHLWGHLQEGVLAQAGVLLQRTDLVDIAEQSAALVLLPAAQSGFARRQVRPYDVASCIESLDRLARATADGQYAAHAQLARAWFGGRNPAGLPVYDRASGRVGDGIDGPRVSSGSGAESNIVAAQALFDDTVRLAGTVPGGWTP